LVQPRHLRRAPVSSPTRRGSSHSSVKTVTINPSTATVAVNATVQLAAALRDSTGAALTGRQVIWTSATEGVATVSATGLVHGATAGNVVIRAESEARLTPPS